MGLLYLVWLHSIKRDLRIRTEYIKMTAFCVSTAECPIIIWALTKQC